MGSVCCCFQGNDFNELGNANAILFRHCLCLSCLTSQFMHMYTALFERGDVRSIPSSASVSTTSIQIADDLACDTYRSPPRPLAYDDPRFSHFQRGSSLILRREKSSSHCHEESEPLRRGGNAPDMDIDSVELKKKGSQFDEETEPLYSESSVKKIPGEIKNELPYYFTSLEDEDACPTCLEEYTPENPRIILKCSHHFHLGCIYEWKERSDNCPVCGKVMDFDEAT